MHELAQGLEAVAGRLGPNEASLVAEVLLAAMSKTTEGYALEGLARGLKAVAVRLGQKEVRKVSEALVAAISKTPDSHVLPDLADGLEVIFERLDPREAALACGKVTDVLLNALTRAASGERVHSLTLAFLAIRVKTISAQLGAKEADRACRQAADALLVAVSKATSIVEAADLGWALEAMSANFGPKEAASICKKLAGFLRGTSEETLHESLVGLLRGLAAVSVHCGPEEAGRAADAFATAMSNTPRPEALDVLGEWLAVVSGRLEPLEADPTCRRAAEAYLVAAGKLPDGWSWLTLSRGMGTVLSRETPSTIRQRPLAVATALAELGNPPARLAVLGMLSPAFMPPPAPLPGQTLVDLLKHPLCVGEARRIVLAQLSRHYNRPFADQWELVRYANENRFGFDFVSPPRRSDRRWSSR